MNEAPSGFYAKGPCGDKSEGIISRGGHFFDKVSKLSRIVNITDINVSGAKEEGGKVILTTPCLATTYRFIEGESVKK